MTTIDEHLEPLDLSGLPPLSVDLGIAPRQEKLSRLMVAYQGLWFVVFLVVFLMLVSTVSNYSFVAWRTVQNMLPSQSDGPGSAGGIMSDPVNARMIQFWAMCGIVGVLILSIVAFGLRYVTAQQQKLMSVPRVRHRIKPAIEFTFVRDGSQTEQYKIEIDVEFYRDIEDSILGAPLERLREAMVLTLQRQIEQAFRQVTQEEMQSELKALCRDILGPDTITGLWVMSLARDVVKGKPGEQTQPETPPSPPLSADEQDIADMQARMVAAKEALRRRDPVHLTSALSSNSRTQGAISSTPTPTSRMEDEIRRKPEKGRPT